MIKASSSVVEKEQDGKKYIRADLLSDTKEEIESMGTNGDVVEGFSDNVIIAPFSTAFTKNKELGVLGSDNVWIW